MTVSLGSSLASEGIYLLTCGRRSLVSETQNEIVVSWITLWGMIKVYWLDFSLHFRSCCLLRICRKFGPKLASHYKPVENEVKLDCPNHVRRTKSSIKKRIIVRRSVRSMFGRTNIRSVKNGLKGALISSCCFVLHLKGAHILLAVVVVSPNGALTSSCCCCKPKECTDLVLLLLL